MSCGRKGRGERYFLLPTFPLFPSIFDFHNSFLLRFRSPKPKSLSGDLCRILEARVFLIGETVAWAPEVVLFFVWGRGILLNVSFCCGAPLLLHFSNNGFLSLRGCGDCGEEGISICLFLLLLCALQRRLLLLLRVIISMH